MSTRPDPGARTPLIPDLDDELVHALGQIEEMLLGVAAWEEDPEDGPGPFVLPASLAARTALEALGRVQDAVAPTQSRTDRNGHDQPPPDPAHRGRLYGPDGRYEHRPLRRILVAQRDLDVLAAAAADTGHALLTGSELGEILDDSAAAAAGPYSGPPTAGQLVEQLARAHGLLDLAATDDTETLQQLLDDAAGADIVLTASQEAAYQRLADRANIMWTLSDPLARWTY